MKKRFFRFAILPLLAGILVGCAELNIGTALRNDPAAPGPVKIGVIAPFSGGNLFANRIAETTQPPPLCKVFAVGVRQQPAPGKVQFSLLIQQGFLYINGYDFS